MSQESVEIVRSIYEAVNRSDWDAAFRHQHPDSELTITPGPSSTTYRGRKEIQGYWEELLSAFEAWTAEPAEFFEHGDRLVVIVDLRARPKGSSAEIANRTGHLWTVRDGTVLSMRLFPQPEKAIETARLGD